MAAPGRRTWRLAAALLAPVALAGLLLVGLAGRKPVPSSGDVARGARDAAPPGLWSPARDVPAAPGVSEAAAERLAALPYLQGYKPAPGHKGVTVHDRRRAQEGVNLVVSGHAAEAFLMDMDGARLHAWKRPVEQVWPDADRAAEGARYWRRAHAFENGDLLAIFDGVGLVRLDRHSRPIWSYRAQCHHDLYVEGDAIYVLTRELRLIPEVHDTRPSLEDFVTVLGPDGRPRRRVSLYAAFRNSPYSPLLARVSHGGDIFHTNTLTILDGSLSGRWPLFARGRALVSLRNLDTVALVDLESEKVLWALTGLWRAQHEPSLLPTGRLLVFDNAGRGGRSQVLELDPFTQQVSWRYPADGQGADLVSETSGSTERLENGNTLITESTAGRALEVTPEGRIVWEFWNPHRAGERHELIATLLEVVRLPRAFGREAGWLREGSAPPE
ncbi:MAG TPA: arylsulfotransferase family protein [Vicinamibacteria bacterium]|nr:arylsulfotransferase family protein [Vicinamibacteria bacterium]